MKCSTARRLLLLESCRGETYENCRISTVLAERRCTIKMSPGAPVSKHNIVSKSLVEAARHINYEFLNLRRLALLALTQIIFIVLYGWRVLRALAVRKLASLSNSFTPFSLLTTFTKPLSHLAVRNSKVAQTSRIVSLSDHNLIYSAQSRSGEQRKKSCLHPVDWFHGPLQLTKNKTAVCN